MPCFISEAVAFKLLVKVVFIAGNMSKEVMGMDGRKELSYSQKRTQSMESVVWVSIPLQTSVCPLR